MGKIFKSLINLLFPDWKKGWKAKNKKSINGKEGRGKGQRGNSSLYDQLLKKDSIFLIFLYGKESMQYYIGLKENFIICVTVPKLLFTKKTG